MGWWIWVYIVWKVRRGERKCGVIAYAADKDDNLTLLHGRVAVHGSSWSGCNEAHRC